ncbi:MAG: Rne/Rng family ribonuclease [Phycisphaeraceae bacterium]
MPKRDMLINIVPGEECRIAIIEDGKLEELYHERTNSESHVGNIYKGRVTNVEPSIQAAFIDFGLERNGFLHITDLHPRYFTKGAKEETERVGFKTPHRERPPIQRCLKRGQEILVQVIKEGIGTKGPTLTSYLSIPGRFLVMMPHMERLGVSRKVEDDEQRRAMKILLDELNPPDNFGFIIRTAGMGRPKTDLKRDLAYLTRLWKNIDKRMGEIRVGELYTESDLLIRTLRDVFSADIERVIVDDTDGARRASDFLAVVSPRSKSQVFYYDEPIPIYHRYGIEQQIDTIHARRVPLPSGGSLVIDSTEALVAIDVNSGKSRSHGDAETTAYKTNQEACDEICRQLRLRDLGGVVVMDLIDMRDTRKRRSIEARFRENLKKDRARTKPLAISQFGILEMTRQRMRPSITKSVYNECHYCHGEGLTRNVDSVVQDVIRQLALIMHREEVAKVAVTVSPDVAFPLLNRKRAELVHMEQKYGTPVQVRVNASGGADFIEVLAMDERGTPLTIDPLAKLEKPVLQPVEALPVEDGIIDDEEALSEERETSETAYEDVGEGDEGTGELKHGDDGRPVPLDEEGGERKRKRRRRRGGRGRGSEDRQTDERKNPAAVRGERDERDGEGDDVTVAQPVEFADAGDDDHDGHDDADAPSAPTGEFAGSAASGEERSRGEGESTEGEGGKRRRRRRRRRGRGGATGGEGQSDNSSANPSGGSAGSTGSAHNARSAQSTRGAGGAGAAGAASSAKPASPPVASRGYVGKQGPPDGAKNSPVEPGNHKDDGADDSSGPQDGAPGSPGADGTNAEGEPRRRRRRRRRRGGSRGGQGGQNASDGDGSSPDMMPDEQSESFAEAVADEGNHNDGDGDEDVEKSAPPKRHRPQRKPPQAKAPTKVESSDSDKPSEEPQPAEA